jgi:hypothetical protein
MSSFNLWVLMKDQPERQQLLLEIQREPKPRILGAQFLADPFELLIGPDPDRPLHFDVWGPRRAHLLERLDVLAREVELAKRLILAGAPESLLKMLDQPA